MGLLSTGESCPMFQGRSRVVEHDGRHLYFGQTPWRWTGCTSCGTFLTSTARQYLLFNPVGRACFTSLALNESNPDGRPAGVSVQGPSDL